MSNPRPPGIPDQTSIGVTHVTDVTDVAAATVDRRHLLRAAGMTVLLAGLTAAGPASAGPVPTAGASAGEALDVAPFRLRLPGPHQEQAPWPGWAWAATTEGVLVQVVGGLRAPTPELVAAGLLGSTSGGRVPLAVTGHPVQTIRGADDYLVWSVEHRAGERHTGALVTVVTDGAAGALLVLGTPGWSPGLRRAILSGVEVIAGA